ncbi:nucleotidyltransferase family protein [Pedobacter psychroterrae]|uniref:Nucleotidyltransferase n=1 Tax=Pedobacter psychroterrae TaxID=2530453 RepID=A0A4R0NJC0_9SPHI|nr:nucleotidyltransferase domain-containing protein [Pedobacter psychroterrae]TCC98984.1 nucleotidyltransferase [Pedobacter psychroterrae]
MNLSPQHISSINRFFSSIPVKRAYLFGSYSRNEANEGSDIDILVELDHSTPIGMKFFFYKDELERILKKKVDLVSYEGLSKYVKPYIDKDKVLIYER